MFGGCARAGTHGRGDGIGGLGSCATQHAKLLGAGATVVAFGRSDEKLKVAKDNGADHTISVGELDAVIECAGSEDSVRLSFALLAIEGAVAPVGLIGNRVDIPLFPLVAREYSYFGSFWGSRNDLTEVLALAESGQVRHTVTRVRFDDVNETNEAIGRGDILGPAVIVYD